MGEMICLLLVFVTHVFSPGTARHRAVAVTIHGLVGYYFCNRSGRGAQPSCWSSITLSQSIKLRCLWRSMSSKRV